MNFLCFLPRSLLQTSQNNFKTLQKNTFLLDLNQPTILNATEFANLLIPKKHKRQHFFTLKKQNKCQRTVPNNEISDGGLCISVARILLMCYTKF